MNKADQYYECHITCKAENIASIRQHVLDGKWLFSKIDGDPDLGPGVKCYATKQLSIVWHETAVIEQLEQFAERLRSKGITVLREKVELIIHDKRHGR